MAKTRDILFKFRWVLLILFFIPVFFIYSSAFVRIGMKYGLVALSLSAGMCIIYSFAGIFTKKKLVKWVITICIATAGLIVWDKINDPPVVHMKEDVLYIHPKSQIKEVNPNNPNLKQDTINR